MMVDTVLWSILDIVDTVLFSLYIYMHVFSPPLMKIYLHIISTIYDSNLHDLPEDRASYAQSQ